MATVVRPCFVLLVATTGGRCAGDGCNAEGVIDGDFGSSAKMATAAAAAPARESAGNRNAGRRSKLRVTLSQVGRSTVAANMALRRPEGGSTAGAAEIIRLVCRMNARSFAQDSHEE